MTTASAPVLSQLQGNDEKVIGYASRALTKPERNYCVTRRELLAVVHFVKYFRQYVYGQKFTIRTDHGALRWLLNFKDPEGQIARWLQVLGEYNFRIIHRAGRSHANADGMSRLPCRQCGRVQNPEGEPAHQESEQRTGEVRGHHDRTHLGRGEDADNATSRSNHRAGPRGDTGRQDETSMAGKYRPYPQLRRHTSTNGSDSTSNEGSCTGDGNRKTGRQVIWQLVLPEQCRHHAIKELHDSKTAGHLGYKKTLAKLAPKVLLVWHVHGRKGLVSKVSMLCNSETTGEETTSTPPTVSGRGTHGANCRGRTRPFSGNSCGESSHPSL